MRRIILKPYMENDGRTTRCIPNGKYVVPPPPAPVVEELMAFLIMSIIRAWYD